MGSVLRVAVVRPHLMAYYAIKLLVGWPDYHTAWTHPDGDK